MPTGGRTTLVQYLIEERRRHPEATGDLNALITDVALACKAISRKVAFGGLAGVLGVNANEAGRINVQGAVPEVRVTDVEPHHSSGAWATKINRDWLQNLAAPRLPTSSAGGTPGVATQ